MASEAGNGGDNGDAENQPQPRHSATHIDDIRHVKLPPFWQANPALWFAQIDAQFYAHKVTSDSARYYAVVAVLDNTILQHISDLLVSPPQTDKYQSLRSQLISRFTDSQETQLRKLLTELQLEDRRPSQLLREMVTLGNKNFNDDVVKTLWLQRLPARVQEVLAVTDTASLEKMAEIADKILQVPEVTPKGTLYSVDPTTSSLASEGSINQALFQLQEQVKTLTKAVNDLKFSHRSRSRSSFYSRRSKSRSNSQNKETGHRQCYYHQRFASKARKCLQPCSFTKEEN